MASCKVIKNRFPNLVIKPKKFPPAPVKYSILGLEAAAYDLQVKSDNLYVKFNISYEELMRSRCGCVTIIGDSQNPNVMGSVSTYGWDVNIRK